MVPRPLLSALVSFRRNRVVVPLSLPPLINRRVSLKEVSVLQAPPPLVVNPLVVGTSLGPFLSIVAIVPRQVREVECVELIRRSP